jgi:AraC-like DNA-binding protein
MVVRASSTDESILTLTLTREAMGALDAHLRSGAARGLPFERPLREALGASPPGLHPKGRRGSLAPRTLRKVRDFIHANLTHDIGIEDIARAAFLSPHHLSRGYRQATGQSLWQHVLAARAKLARELIAAEPQATLADIAARSGFGSYGQFIAAFRKTFGQTPGDWRRLQDEAVQ